MPGCRGARSARGVHRATHPDPRRRTLARRLVEFRQSACEFPPRVRKFDATERWGICSGANPEPRRAPSAPNPVIILSNITYTVAVTNFGPGDANSVTLTNPLPAGVSFVDGDWMYDEFNGEAGIKTLDITAPSVQPNDAIIQPLSGG